MGNTIFSSQLISSDGITYKAELYGEDYIGFPKVAIVSGSGNTYIVSKDWTDFLEVGQVLYLYTGGETLNPVDTFNTYKARVVADSGIVENDDCAIVAIGSLAYTTATITAIYSSGPTTLITLNIAYSGSYTSIGSSLAPSEQYAPTFAPDIMALNTEWGGEGDEILGAIKDSSSTITYANNDVWFDRFFEQYKITQDNKLKFLIYKEDGAAWDLDWAGIIVMDLVEWANDSKPIPYTFKAIDGLAALKFYEYTQETLEQNTAIRNVFDILGLLDLYKFWGATDAYLRESIEYKSRVLEATTTDADSPLDYTYISDNFFIEDANKFPTKFKSYYDVLKGILDIYSCRMYIANGVYYIQQVRNFKNENITFREYLVDSNNDYTYSEGNYVHQRDVGNTTEDFNILAGGTFGYYAGAYKVKMEQKRHFEGSHINEDVKSVIANDDPTSQDSYTFPIGKINGDGLGNIQVAIPIFDSHGRDSILDGNTLDDTFLNPIKVTNYVVKVMVAIYSTTGNRYLRGTTPRTFSQYENEWTEDLVVPADERNVVRYVQSGGNNTTLFVNTPVINFDDDFEISITFEYIGQNAKIGLLQYAKAMDVTRVRILFPLTEVNENYDKYIELDNPTGFFTKEVELDPLLFIDSAADTSTVVKIQINSAYNSGGVSLVPTTTFDGGFLQENGDPLYLFLSIMRVYEAMSLQYKPVERMMSTIVGDYYPFYSLAYNDKVYVFSGCTKDYTMDEVQGEWFEVISAMPAASHNIITDYIGTVDDIKPFSGEEKHNTVGAFNSRDAIGFIDNVEIGTHDTLPINPYQGDRLFKGDVISIFDPNNTSEIEFFTVRENVEIDDIEILVDSKTTTFPMREGSIVVYKKGETMESNRVRANIFQMKGNALDPKFHDYLQDGEFVFYDEHAYYRNPIDGFVYKFNGAKLHP